MNTYRIEITDTFGGEANYCWVRRYSIDAASERGAIQKLAKQYGAGWRKVWDDGETSRYDLRGSCICLFIEQAEVIA